MGAAVGQDSALDGSPAGLAGFSFAAVHLQQVKKTAGFAIGIVEVTESRSTVADGAAQDLGNGSAQRFDPVGWNPATDRAGIDTGGKQGFIRVNVTQAGDPGLVEQQVFNGAFALENGVKTGRFQVKGFGAKFAKANLFHDRFEVSHNRAQNPEPAKAARIHKIQSAAITDMNGKMGMFQMRLAGTVQHETTGHPKLYDQDPVGRNCQDQALGPAGYLADPLTGVAVQFRLPVGQSGTFNNHRCVNGNLIDDAVQDFRSQSGGHMFYFG